MSWNWDEQAYLAYCETIRAAYREAGREPDDYYPVWPGRATWDACNGLPWPVSCAKHLRECRDALGLVPPPPPAHQLPRLVPQGTAFVNESGVPFTAIQCSDFNLFARYQQGEDITPVLLQRRDTGFNMLRVWTLFNIPGIGTLLNPDYARIPGFLALCARYDLYVELTAFTSTERPSHWPALIDACQEQRNVLLELGNELDLPVNHIDMSRYSKPYGVLASHGSASSETVPPWAVWDYVTFHTNGAYEEQRKVGHNAMEIWSGPTLTNETSRYPEVGMWRGAPLPKQAALAFDSAAGAALLCAGSCFHSVSGKLSLPFSDAERAVAAAWVGGAQSVPLTCQPGPYRRRDDLLTDDLLRVYQRGDSENCIVRIRR